MIRTYTKSSPQRSACNGRKRPKVIIAAHLPPSVGGPAALLSDILSSSLSRDFELIPFNIGRPPKPHVRNNFGYRSILNAGIRRTLIAIWITLHHLLQFPLVLFREHPDIVHIHTAPYWVFWETTLYLLACRLAGVRCALQMHFSFRYFYDNSPRILRNLMLSVLRLSSLFVVICRDDIEFLREIGAEDIPTFYLPNCVDVGRIQAITENSAAVEEKTFPEILFLGGSDTVRKGLPELLLTIPFLVERFPELRFRLVAVPKGFVSELVPSIYRDRCVVESWISGEAKFERLARADIFVLPTHAEGMPIAILEAMAAGTPVVASRVAGIPDMIRDGEEGVLVSSGDVSALAKALSTLLESQNMRVEMGKRAAKRASKQYDLSVGVSNFRNLYNLMTNKMKSHCQQNDRPT